jgi:hypothetical protein
MMTALGYQLGVFINIDSDETHFASYTGRFPNRVRCFATRREGDNVVVWEEW